MEISNNSQFVQINTNKPRESRVFADGDYVIKVPTATKAEYIKVWLEKQEHAKQVVDALYQKKSPASKKYFVPKIVEIQNTNMPYVRESRVMGKPLTKDVFDKLTQMQQEQIYDTLVEFIYDMNQSQPVYDLIHLLDAPDNQGYTFQTVLATMKPFLSEADYVKLNDAYKLFKSHPEKTVSYVFFHGDINENNIFYDTDKGNVSFIDFSDAKYENADYMFNHDLAKLPWVDINKLKNKYINKAKNNIRIKSDGTVVDLFNSLRAFQWIGESMLAHSAKATMFKGILAKNIQDVHQAYQRCIESAEIQYNLMNNSRI